MSNFSMVQQLWEHSLVRLLRHAVEKYQRENCGQLAYFALFSFFPLILVSLSVVGFFVDPEEFEVQQQLLQLIGSEEIRDLVTQTLAHFNANRVNAGLIGFGTLFLTAAGIFGALNRAFDIIWEVRGDQLSSVRSMVLSAVWNRLLNFGMLLGVAGLILLSTLGGVVLNLVARFTDWMPRGDLLISLGQLSITLALMTLAMASLFKFMPDAQVRWADVLPAALITAVLFLALQSLTGLIFGSINFSSYGAVGGAMTLLLWIYFCCQIILVGGEISYAWANVYGSLRK
jgi:membrane protein